MKKTLSIMVTAASLCMLPSAYAFAQTTGTSHPEELDDTQPTVPVDNSHYVPPTHSSSTVTQDPEQTANTADDNGTEQTAPVLYRHSAPEPGAPVQTASLAPSDPTLAVTSDVNSGVVTYVPLGPNDLPIGTLLKADLKQPISTLTTAEGSRFSATLSADVVRNGVTLLPSGSIIYGRVAHIHGGRRIGGASVIRLQPDSVSLPDGTTYRINAEVNDLGDFQTSHVNNEGTIVASSHPAVTAGAVGLTTTSAVVAGAVMGGPIGAVVGLGVGGGASTIVWLKQDRQQQLPAGTQIVFALSDSLHVNPTAH